MNATVDSPHSPSLHDATISRIVFWQPIASPHQEAFLESLARQFTGEVILGVEQALPAERRAQGWRQPSHRKVNVVDISIPTNHAALLAAAFVVVGARESVQPQIRIAFRSRIAEHASADEAARRFMEAVSRG